MNPIDAALAKVQKNPDHPSSKVLYSLLVALDTGEPFSFKQLYKVLDYNDFTLALGVMREWRLEEMRCKKGRGIPLAPQAFSLRMFLGRLRFSRMSQAWS